MSVLSHPHTGLQFVPVVWSCPWEPLRREWLSSFFHPPFRYSYTLMRFSLNFSFSRLNSPSSLSLSLYRAGCSSPLIIFMALHWIFSTVYWKRSSKCNPGNIAQKMLTTVLFSRSLMLSHMREWALEMSTMRRLKESMESSGKDLYWLDKVSHTRRKKFCSLQFFLILDVG